MYTNINKQITIIITLTSKQVDSHIVGLTDHLLPASSNSNHLYNINISSSSVLAVPDVSLQYCTEAWPSSASRNVYDVVFLFLVYVLPGSLTVCLYARIGTTLWAKDQALARQNSYVANESKMVRRFQCAVFVLAVNVGRS